MAHADPTPTSGTPRQEKPKPDAKPVPGLHAGKTYADRYQLVDRIAIGGMGEVWKAHDLATDSLVAIKILRPEYAGQEQFLSRLRVEASNAKRLKHPNLAQVYDSGEEDGLGWIVMELVDGKPLTKMLQQRRILPLDILLPILRQTADALSAVHSAGVVHRDIKPGNILITTDGQVKLTDFGISRSQNQVTLTAAGMVMGTAQYLPPEQAIGHQATPAGDLYALGVIAYEALVGKRPFRGDSQVDIAFAHVNTPVPPMPDRIHPAVRKLVMNLLDKKPGNRPPTAAKVSYMISELETQLLGTPQPEQEAEPLPPITSLDGGTVPAPYTMPQSIVPDPDVIPARRDRTFAKHRARAAAQATAAAQPQSHQVPSPADHAQDAPVHPTPAPSQPVSAPTDRPQPPAQQPAPPEPASQPPLANQPQPPANRPASPPRFHPVHGSATVPQATPTPAVQPPSSSHQDADDAPVAAATVNTDVKPHWHATGRPHPAAISPALIIDMARQRAYDNTQARHSAGVPREQHAIAWMVTVGISAFVSIIIILFHIFHMKATGQTALGDPVVIPEFFSGVVKEALYV